MVNEVVVWLSWSHVGIRSRMIELDIHLEKIYE
jgi:hypothetical protein